MSTVAARVQERVLPAEPVMTLREYEAGGGGRGWSQAQRLAPVDLIELVGSAGLRGRGGAGFPTGVKWRTVAGYGSSQVPTTVVVNGAEGEPGTFKDRAIVRRNPHAVVEGALIAARAVGADRAVIALKASFAEEQRRITAAIGECEAAGWCVDVNVGVVTGPGEYLFGEETGLLEVLDGRPPFPRLAPPFRQGVEEVGPEPDEPAGARMAAPGGGPAPTLVNNVETLANVPAIVADGPDRFRELGTAESPGTLVCTITGATARHGVAELPMGTSLADAIALIGDEPTRPRRRLVAAMSGVANRIVTADQFATPLSYEAMQAVGSGLGAGGFIVFDEATDFCAVAAGVARFLAVESCGQCTPCKQDGLAIAERLARLCRNEATDQDLAEALDRIGTVATGARCYLATQHEQLLDSIFGRFPDHFQRHVDGHAEPLDPMLIAPIVELDGDQAVVDADYPTKQPDWTYDEVDSGKAPVERLAEGGPEAGR